MHESDCQCADCVRRRRDRAYYHANAEKLRAQRREYYAADPVRKEKRNQAQREKLKELRASIPPHPLAEDCKCFRCANKRRQNAYYERHKERLKEQGRQRAKEYRKKYPERYQASKARQEAKPENRRKAVERSRRWRQKNLEYFRAYLKRPEVVKARRESWRKYYASQGERIRAHHREWSKREWRRLNPSCAIRDVIAELKGGRVDGASAIARIREHLASVDAEVSQLLGSGGFGEAGASIGTDVSGKDESPKSDQGL